MNTRQDMFQQNIVQFLIEQEKRHLITRKEYVEFYDFLNDWNRLSTSEHPREENTWDCQELIDKGTHV